MKKTAKSLGMEQYRSPLKMGQYFSLVQFDRLREFEQIKRLLFFITEVVQLRLDMTPKVISNRLNEERVATRISPQEVKRIMDKHQGIFLQSRKKYVEEQLAYYDLDQCVDRGESPNLNRISCFTPLSIAL